MCVTRPWILKWPSDRHLGLQGKEQTSRGPAQHTRSRMRPMVTGGSSASETKKGEARTQKPGRDRAKSPSYQSSGPEHNSGAGGAIDTELERPESAWDPAPMTVLRVMVHPMPGLGRRLCRYPSRLGFGVCLTVEPAV